MTFKARVLILRKEESQTLQGVRCLQQREHAYAVFYHMLNEERRGEGSELTSAWKEGIGQPGLDSLALSDMGTSGGAEEQALTQGYRGSGRDLKLLKHVL